MELTSLHTNELAALVGALRPEDALARTGWCAVYRTTHSVGYKALPLIIKRTLRPDANESARLDDEARVLSSLSDRLRLKPDLTPKLLGFASVEGTDVLAMSYAPGPSLEDVVTSRLQDPVNPAYVLSSARRLLHLLNVVHGELGRCLPDFKRNNIRVGRVGVRVIDWNVLADYDPEHARADIEAVLHFMTELLVGRLFASANMAHRFRTKELAAPLPDRSEARTDGLLLPQAGRRLCHLLLSHVHDRLAAGERRLADWSRLAGIYEGALTGLLLKTHFTDRERGARDLWEQLKAPDLQRPPDFFHEHGVWRCAAGRADRPHDATLPPLDAWFTPLTPQPHRGR